MVTNYCNPPILLLRCDSHCRRIGSLESSLVSCFKPKVQLSKTQDVIMWCCLSLKEQLKESRKEGKKVSWPKHQTLRLGIWEESKRFAMKLAIGGLSIHNHLTSWSALLIFKIRICWYQNKNGSIWTCDLTEHLTIQLETNIALAPTTYIVDLPSFLEHLV